LFIPFRLFLFLNASSLFISTLGLRLNFSYRFINATLVRRVSS